MAARLSQRNSNNSLNNKTELVIATVKKHPILYDTSHEKYKRIRLKNILWNQIAENLQAESGEAVKSKWRNLKDSCCKHIRANDPVHTPTKHIIRYKTWPWAKHMSFLRPHIVITEPSTSREFTKEENDDFFEDEFTKQSSDDENFDRSEQFEPEVDQQVGSPINFGCNHSQYDDVDLIFLGYAKTIMKMSLERQATVKFKIAKIMMEAELEHAQSTLK